MDFLFVWSVKQQDALNWETAAVVFGNLDEQPLAFVTLANLFNGFGTNFAHLSSPAKIVALKSLQARMSVRVQAIKAERLHAYTLAPLHSYTLARLNAKGGMMHE